MPEILGRLLTRNSCCVDVGAHLGSFLRLILKAAPEGRHVAFEPSALRGRWLKDRFPSVTIYPHAVSDRAGSATFHEDQARPGFSSIVDRSENANCHVTTCRLDDVLVDAECVDFIKFDIEGHELAALRGATEIISRRKPSIIFECGAERDHGALFEFINGVLGYRIYCFGDYLFDKGPLSNDEFRKCGLYPFRAFNFVALPAKA